MAKRGLRAGKPAWKGRFPGPQPPSLDQGFQRGWRHTWCLWDTVQFVVCISSVSYFGWSNPLLKVSLIQSHSDTTVVRKRHYMIWNWEQLRQKDNARECPWLIRLIDNVILKCMKAAMPFEISTIFNDGKYPCPSFPWTTFHNKCEILKKKKHCIEGAAQSKTFISTVRCSIPHPVTHPIPRSTLI